MRGALVPFSALTLTVHGDAVQRFDLEGLDVFFPYDRMYPEQYNYMLELKRSLDAKVRRRHWTPEETGGTVCFKRWCNEYGIV